MNPNRIRKTRRQLGLTQHDFAKRLGVSYATVNRWEKGRAKPQPDRLERLDELIAAVENGDIPRNSQPVARGHSRFPRKFSNKVTLHGSDAIALSATWTDLVAALADKEPEIEMRVSVKCTPDHDCSRIRAILEKVKPGWVI